MGAEAPDSLHIVLFVSHIKASFAVHVSPLSILSGCIFVCSQIPTTYCLLLSFHSMWYHWFRHMSSSHLNLPNMSITFLPFDVLCSALDAYLTFIHLPSIFWMVFGLCLKCLSFIVLSPYVLLIFFFLLYCFSRF